MAGAGKTAMMTKAQLRMYIEQVLREGSQEIFVFNSDETLYGTGLVNDEIFIHDGATVTIGEGTTITIMPPELGTFGRKSTI